MLIGIYGPHSIGKTTFMRHLIVEFQALKAAPALLRVTLVQADNELEWSIRDDLVSNHRWKDKALPKRRLVHELIADDTRLYIMESARFFSGMWPEIVAAYKLARGGAQFIIPVASPDDLQYFIQQRCIMNGKPYRSDVWGPKAHYESDFRYSNPMRKWLTPAGIPWSQYVIGRERKTWKQIEVQIWRLIATPPEDWYYGC